MSLHSLGGVDLDRATHTMPAARSALCQSRQQLVGLSDYETAVWLTRAQCTVSTVHYLCCLLLLTSASRALCASVAVVFLMSLSSPMWSPTPTKRIL